MARMIEQWGVVPLTYLSTLADDRYTYGYIGTEDFTMYPLLPPGSFVQIDETKNRVVEGVWRSEMERPICNRIPCHQFRFELLSTHRRPR